MLRVFVIVVVLSLLAPAHVHAQGTLAWYNGDCKQLLVGGFNNWYTSNQQYQKVFDTLIVPAGGWTVSGVFSVNLLYTTSAITQAAWEIRRGAPDSSGGGTIVASGVGAAVTSAATDGGTRIQVNGLTVALPPGQYLLNVAPAGTASRESYVCETQGQNGVGSMAGKYVSVYGGPGSPLYSVTTGTNGKEANFSQGLYISGPAPDAQAPPSFVDQWRANLTSLVQQMPAHYGLPFPGISLDDFNARAMDLYDRLPNLTDGETYAGFQSLVASIADPHTDVEWMSPRPFQYIPLSFYWFEEGIYVTAAPAQYRNLLGAKLVSVGSTGIWDATRVLSALVPHDNDQWVKYVIPMMELPNAHFLAGTGLISGTSTVRMQLETVGDGVATVDIPTLSETQRPRQSQVFQGDLPLYRQHPDWNYWATIIDNGATLYFQYNSCMEDTRQPSSEFMAQLHDLMNTPGVERIVLDMRNNGGGFTAILSPWVEEMRTSRFNTHDRLYVITGRATFSAAMEHSDLLKDRTNATFVGEATGAKPQFKLRRGDFALPYMNVRVSFSNGTEGAQDPGDSLYPDIPTPVTFQDYMNGVDPALDAILALPIPGRE